MAVYQIETDQGTFEVETEEPKTLAETATSKLKENIVPFLPILKATKKIATTPEAKEFGTSFAEEFGIPSERSLDGEILTPQMATGRAFGRLAGQSLKLGAAEATGGAAFGVSPAIRALGPLGRSVSKSLGTGLTYEATEGAIKRKPVKETVEDMAKGGITFSGLAMGGQALGYLRKLFGRDLSESITNHFINTNAKIAEKLAEQKKPSLGSQTLKDFPEIIGFKNRKEAYDIAGEELSRIENQIRFITEENRALIQKPLIPSVDIKGIPSLEYKPASIQTIKPSSIPSGQQIRTPFTISEKITKTNIPKTTREVTEIEKDVFGVEIGRTTKKESLYPPSELGGFTRKYDVGFTPDEEATKVRSEIGKAVRGLKPLPEFSVGGGQRQGTINLRETTDTLNKLKKKSDIGSEEGFLSKLNNMQEGIIKRNGEVVDITRAMELKRNMDDLAGNIYLKTVDSKSALKASAYEAMANDLRRQLYSIDPELGKLAAKESLLIRIRIGLLPVVAKKGGSRLPFGIYSTIVNAIESSPLANLTAKGLSKTLGTPSKYISPFSGKAARIAYSEQNED
ncbi:MAG: hypothetical protein A2W75_04010 [Nitrospinae bacterium RIFCSPLOWO2_12_39_15]|nr:MAG: hypothetical protein A2W75_04010 [Nitrospinae bacterium RIFCSPLOWO2_12_39_15]